MNISLDSYYEIGNDHVVCDDYALHGQVNGMYYAIVADGCSSSKNTDIGSRIVAHSAVVALSKINDPSFLSPEKDSLLVDAPFPVSSALGNLILGELHHMSKSILLPSSAFDSTLVLLLLYKNRLWHFMWGDGSIIWSYGDQLQLLQVKYHDEAPYYLSYQLDPIRDHAYCEQFKWQNKEICYTLGFDSRHFSEPLQPYFEYKDLDYFNNYDSVSVVVTTDGIDSYNHLPVEIAAKQYVDYKNTAGYFVTRRMRRIRRNCLNDNIEHYDDIACAAMHIKDFHA